MRNLMYSFILLRRVENVAHGVLPDGSSNLCLIRRVCRYHLNLMLPAVAIQFKNAGAIWMKYNSYRPCKGKKKKKNDEQWIEACFHRRSDLLSSHRPAGKCVARRGRLLSEAERKIKFEGIGDTCHACWMNKKLQLAVG